MSTLSPFVRACYTHNFSAAKRVIKTIPPLLDYTLCGDGQSAALAALIGITEPQPGRVAHSLGVLRTLRLLLQERLWRPGCAGVVEVI